MQGFCFFVEFGLVRFHWEKIRSIYYLHFDFEKHVPSPVLKDFSIENLKTTLRFIYLELLIIGVVF